MACSMCRSIEVPVVAVPLIDPLFASDAFPQICMRCIGDIVQTAGMKIVEHDAPNHDAASVIQRQNELIEHLALVARRHQGIIERMVKNGWSIGQPSAIYCATCFRSFRSGSALAAHLRDSECDTTHEDALDEAGVIEALGETTESLNALAGASS